MQISTLLARQMELHTSVRHPPKSPSDLVRFRVQMHHYKTFFSKLKWMSTQLSTEADTVFQCLMYISLGGVVSFDKQHQDGSVPMHQAKVLARDTAIQLEPALRQLVPHEELMVYVGASKDLRATLRVKVEDGNDLVTAEKSVQEAVEYLDFIYAESGGNPDTMFAFYMVEDEQSLNRLLEASAASPLSSSGPGFGSTFSGTVTQTSPLTDVPLDPLPPVNRLIAEIRPLCELAGDTKARAPDRITAAQTVAQWLREMTTEDFHTIRAALMNTLDASVSVLITEKRSALCRVGCDAVSCVMVHVADTPQVFAEGEPVCAVLSRWVSALCRGIYVTVSAIATATDYALRDIFTQSHGSAALTKTLVSACERGTQTELRRKCLGYMCLSLCAADGDRRTLVQLARLLIPISQRYVTVGDSPSRKMARALVAVLRAVTGEAVPIEDAKTARLVEVELGHVQEAVKGGPRALEKLIFESDSFISSMKRPLASQAGGANGAAAVRHAPQAVASGQPNKCPRVTQTSAARAVNAPESGTGSDALTSHSRHTHASSGAQRAHHLHGPSVHASAPTTSTAAPVYETNDSLVARRWSVDVESDPGVSCHSLSTRRTSLEPVSSPASRVPYTNGQSALPFVEPVSTSSVTRRPGGPEGTQASGTGDVAGTSLPRISPSLQRKIAQSRSKTPID